MKGLSGSDDGIGVYGYATAATGGTGVYGQSNSTNGVGVTGYTAAGASGVAGLSDNSTGVFGYSSTTYGGYFRSHSTSGTGVYGVGGFYGVYGETTAPSGTTYGGYFSSDSTSGRAVGGMATAPRGTNYGVYGQSSSTAGTGVYGLANGSSGITYGGNFSSTSTNGRGVYGVATATSGTNYGVYGQSASASGYGGVFQNTYGGGTSLAALSSGGSVVFTVKTRGLVGIGTTTPSNQLHVVGDVLLTGCLWDGVTILIGSCASDARFKKNIVSFTPMLDKVAALRPVHFDWRVEEFPEKHFGTRRSFGLIAQEVEEVLPELVTEDEDGYKAVRYNKLPLLNTQAIGELKAKNDALRDEVAELREIVELLQQRLGVEVSQGRK